MRFVERYGVDAGVVMTAPDLVSTRRSARASLHGQGITGCLVHSGDWARQPYPHLFLLALALAPVEHRYIVDERAGTASRCGLPRLLLELARSPVELAYGMALSGAEAARHWRGARRLPQDGPRQPLPRPGRWILAIWRGAVDSDVGGAVTHASGIFGGFRQLGYRVVLVTAAPPPEQVTGSVDEVIVARPLPRGARASRESAMLALNRCVRAAAESALARVRPAFMYQRHEFLLRAGADIAAAHRLPLVLEWNASEVWARYHWLHPGPLAAVSRGLIKPLAASVEREVLRRSVLVAAVSHPAAVMACEAGADPRRVAVVPNGVDVEIVRPPEHGVARLLPGPHVGWIGSFGPWHGADVLIRALAVGPPAVRLTLIGDGPGREAAEALARSLGVADRITWAGQLPHPEALARLGACDILVSPHLPLPDTPFFGSPTKLFEYMALGRPIVASRLEQLEHVLEHEQTALLVPPGDAPALAEAIGRILHDPELGRRMGSAARAEAASRHTWERRARLVLSKLGLPHSGAERVDAAVEAVG